MDVRRVSRVVGLVGAALAVGVAVTGGRARRTDERAFFALNRLADERVDGVASAITEFGSIWASVGAAAVLAARGHRRAAARGLTAAGLTWLAGQALKRLFERQRPYEAEAEGTRLLIGPPKASSWPSSHPAVLLSFVEVAGREAGLRRSVRAALAGLAGAVGVSRVVVGVHYPGDVAGGLLLGRAVAEGVAGNGR
ncbi:MAG TPA: phosphatase PAP2 family protein [Actinomycetota bacterium]|nr:phosphatase PAP2 family protein [Actinomycetota bacterium]